MTDTHIAYVDDKGEPWFVAADVCQSLEIKNTTQAIQSLDDDERSMYSIGRQGKANIVSESGLFVLIFQSRKPEAKTFRKWVTSEILPSIRKHGVYQKEKLTEPKRLTEKSFIEHDGSFWLDTDTIVMELKRIGLENADEDIEISLEEGHGEFLKSYTARIKDKDCFKEYGILYLLLIIAFEINIKKEEVISLCVKIEGLLDSLKGKDLTHVKIAAVRAYQEVVSRLNNSGRNVDFVRSLIRYKEKDLSVDEISVLTGYSRNDIAIYLEELESSGIMEMAELLKAVPESMPAAQQCLPSAATFANPTQEQINKLGYNEAMVLHQLQTMIQGSGKKRILITYADWLKRFPFKSQETLQRTVRKLEKQGIIQSRRLMVHFQRIKEYWVE